MGQIKANANVLELSSVKELQGLITTIAQNQSAIEARGTQLAKELGVAANTKRAVADALLSAKSAGQAAKTAINEFIAKGKEIGVDVSKQQEIGRLEKAIEQTKEYDDWFKSIGNIPDL